MVDTIICTIDHCWMDSTLAAISSSSRRHSFVWSFHGPHFHGQRQYLSENSFFGRLKGD
jgi:hypothetical protein